MNHRRLPDCGPLVAAEDWQFATIDQRLRMVEGFMGHVNEDPWNWTSVYVESSLLTCAPRSTLLTRRFAATIRLFARSPATSANPMTAKTGSSSTLAADLWFSGKHKRHGGNIQVLTD